MKLNVKFNAFVIYVSKPRPRIHALYSMLDDLTILELFLIVLFLIFSRYGYETENVPLMIFWEVCTAVVFSFLLVRFNSFKKNFDEHHHD